MLLIICITRSRKIIFEHLETYLTNIKFNKHKISMYMHIFVADVYFIRLTQDPRIKIYYKRKKCRESEIK